MKTPEQHIRPVAVVSGGFGLLGMAVGRRLLADGFHVALLCRESSENKQKEKLELLASANVSAHCVDIRDHSAVLRVLGEIERAHGTIEVAIHAANAPILRKKISELDPEIFHEQFSVGVFGGFNFLSSAATLMKKAKKGVLIGLTTAAIEGDGVEGNFGGYIAAKFALKGLLTELAQELKVHNIHVHAVAPGFVEGGLNKDLHPRMVEFLKEKYGYDNFVLPEDVANALSEIVRYPDDPTLTVIVDQD